MAEDHQRQTTLAYLAGLFDGEGTIGVYPNRGRGSYSLHVRLAMCHEPTVRWMGKMLGGVVVREEGRTKTGKSVWLWRVYAQTAGEILFELLPYLKVKRREAQLALQFLSAETLEQKERLSWAISQAKHSTGRQKDL